MRTLLLYNPVSGRNLRTRPQTVQAIAALFTEYGHITSTEPTTGPGSAAAQARTAIAQGTELILACGGDGTVHDVVQGLIDPQHPTPTATLGVIPMGSANALARHLGLSTNPLTAAGQLLAFTPHTIPVGHLETAARSRYFTVLTGAGPSGALVFSYPNRAPILPWAKRRFGRLGYYVHAAAIFLTHRFPSFELHWTDLEGTAHTTQAIGTMTVRIDSMGGLFHPLAPAGRVDHPHLNLVAIRPPGWLALPVWFAASWLGLRHRAPLVLHAEAESFTLTPAPNSRPIHLQADGEWIGTAPARIRLLPAALRLLMPRPPST